MDIYKEYLQEEISFEELLQFFEGLGKWWVTPDGQIATLEKRVHGTYVADFPGEFNLDSADIDALPESDDDSITILAMGEGAIRVDEHSGEVGISLTEDATREAFSSLKDLVEDEFLESQPITVEEGRAFKGGESGKISYNALLKQRSPEALLNRIRGSQSNVQRFHRG